MSGYTQLNQGQH